MTAPTSNPNTLAHIRTWLESVTGRSDLVNSDGSDNGMDQYVNAGVRFLDDRAHTHKSLGRLTELLPAGSSRITFQNCKSIMHVWVTDGDARVKLNKLDFQVFRLKYPDLMLDIDASLTPPIVNIGSGTGQPLDYTISPSGLAPEQNYVDPEDFGEDNTVFRYDYYDVQAGDHYAYRQIIFAPIPDQEYTISLFGDFDSQPLVDDADKNFWSVKYPHVLVMAAAYMMEIMWRNTQGASDWLAQINLSITLMDNNNAEEEAFDVTKIDG